MTCRGYDVKAVRISKSVKRLASTFQDRHERGAFIRSYVEAEQTNRFTGKKDKKDKKD